MTARRIGFAEHDVAGAGRQARTRSAHALSSGSSGGWLKRINRRQACSQGTARPAGVEATFDREADPRSRADVTGRIDGQRDTRAVRTKNLD